MNVPADAVKVLLQMLFLPLPSRWPESPGSLCERVERTKIGNSGESGRAEVRGRAGPDNGLQKYQ